MPLPSDPTSRRAALNLHYEESLSLASASQPPLNRTLTLPNQVLLSLWSSAARQDRPTQGIAALYLAIHLMETATIESAVNEHLLLEDAF